jgi:hypothetical protein
LSRARVGDRIAAPEPDETSPPLVPDRISTPHPAHVGGGSVTWLSPWPLFRAHTRSIVLALVTFVTVLLAVEFALFRSGFVAAHASVSHPDFPLAKLALAVRQPSQVLYVGDSTVLTGIAPAVASERCSCGPGFNGAFKAATPQLVAAMTRRLLAVQQPKLVVLGVSPWQLSTTGHFTDTYLDGFEEEARELLTPAELAALGQPLDVVGTIDSQLRALSVAYGQRLLVKEWAGSAVPQQRYDESLRGLYVPPGSASSPAQLAAAAEYVFRDLSEPTTQSQGATVFDALIADLRARGIAVAILLPPLHPAAYDHAGPYLDRADALLREFASGRGAALIDCRAAVSAADFRDLDHLLQAGAMKQSTCVGRRLQALLRD